MTLGILDYPGVPGVTRLLNIPLNTPVNTVLVINAQYYIISIQRDINRLPVVYRNIVAFKGRYQGQPGVGAKGRERVYL